MDKIEINVVCPLMFYCSYLMFPIVKFNHKTVVVRTDDHHQWKVAPHYLKPWVEGEAAQVHNVATISSRQNR